MAVQGWSYTENVPEARREALAVAGSFPALLELVVSDVSDVRVRLDRGFSVGLDDCERPVFTFDLVRTGDAFFNGPFGYRAQYWRSPEEGVAANLRSIAALTPKLVQAVVDSEPGLRNFNVRASLQAMSAKFWRREGSDLLTPTADLCVSRWSENARQGVQNALLGLMAPDIAQFEVKGAFLNPQGHEIVPAAKIARHLDIYECGYS